MVEPSDDKSGFSYKKWYDEHKSTFNAARRRRYQADPSYREKVLKWNRASRKGKRSHLAKERIAEANARKVILPVRRWKTDTAIIRRDGKKVEEKLYSVGALAEVLGRSIQVIRLWEHDGVIPKTPHRNAKGDRMYTAEQMREILDLLTRAGRLVDQGGRQRQSFRAFPHKVRFSNNDVRVVKLYKVGVLARAIDRTIVTVEQMEQREALPQTPFRASSTGYRLYTLGMVQVVREAFQKQDCDIRGEQKRLEFYADVRKGWERLGVIGATLLEEVTGGEDT